MSRCKKCHNVFDEDNGWQEFCSMHCAQLWVCGKTVEDIDPDDRRDQKRLDAWNAWIADSKNARLVRPRNKPEPPPAVGRYEWRLVEWEDANGKKLRKRLRVNVGSEVTVRPMTDAERRTAERNRGRGFSDGHVYNPMVEDLPSKHGQVGKGWFPHD